MKKTLLAFLVVSSAGAQSSAPVKADTPAEALASVPSLNTLVSNTTSELAPVIERYSADLASVNRRYDASGSPDQRQRMRAFYTSWRARLAEIPFDRLKQEGKVDYVLLDNRLRYQLALLDRADKERRETADLLPFADRLLSLQDRRRDLVPVDPVASARTLSAVTKQIDSLRARVESAGRGNAAPGISRTVANRAAEDIDRIRNVVGGWYRYYDGYDPLFTWWVREPFTRIDESLTSYARAIRTRLVGIPAAQATVAAAGGAGGAAGGRGGAGGVGGAAGGRGGAGGAGGAGGGRGGAPGAGAPSPTAAAAAAPIIGDPIGAEGLAADLAHEMIPYTPEELMAIAEKEYAFSLSEAKKAAREMGLGDDWKAAMEKVKNTYVEPGKQPELIRKLAREAEEFFAKHDWITIPELAKEDWGMEMLSPERQRTSPFFLGGANILVSYPTAEMSDEDKLMSLRGNNPHFSRATVHHELNPGHHLQQFMMARYNQHRRVFSTPFWNEGQSLYWEMFLWDHDFIQTPEDRIGALFWRMHRSARIIFSMKFHLGQMTPEQAIQFLVDTVAFERANADAEVRRSFNGTYPPLYQAGYMLGGLQIRALYQQLVPTRKMTDRQFHDAIIQGGPMPIAMVRARLANLPLTREGPAPWRFADELPPPRPRPAR
ncbi:MAG TPA: DUF885 family protein [Gemmatimonadaceae bacterium]|nr:DUF885 family protein [Gemmatimonadaceae bacterium]